MVSNQDDNNAMSDQDDKKNMTSEDDSYWDSLLDHVDNLGENGVQITSDDTPETIHRPRASELPLWEDAKKAMDTEDTFELVAIGCNKGGLLVEWNGLPGFVPASQLNNFPNVHIEEERVKELEARKGQNLKLKIIEVNLSKNSLIFSERASQVEPDKRLEIWEDIAVGDRRTGIVTNMTNFGAFVDLGGVEGLIHISELSWSRLNHPEDVVRPGQEVTAVILDIDRPKGRVALSLKQMKPDPWADVEQRYKPDEIVEGLVSNVVSYGAFVTLEDELEGLIHVSEVSAHASDDPLHAIKKGEMIKARVLTVSSKNRRIALSLRNMPQE